MKMHTLTALSALALAAAPAAAQTSLFTADLEPLNGSGVSGTALLTLDQGAGTLTVDIVAAGLEPDMPHAQHIHGRFDGPDGFDGGRVDSVVPGIDQDADGDGFIELGEGLSEYGPVILPLSQPPASGDDPATLSFPTAPTGTLTFSQTYDLNDEGQFFFPMMPPAMGGPDYTGDDVTPLDFGVIVLHGLTVDGTAGAGTSGEIDGTAGYKPTLPVSAGAIVAVPEPAAAAGLLTAGGLLLARRRR